MWAFNNSTLSRDAHGFGVDYLFVRYHHCPVQPGRPCVDLEVGQLCSMHCLAGHCLAEAIVNHHLCIAQQWCLNCNTGLCGIWKQRKSCCLLVIRSYTFLFDDDDLEIIKIETVFFFKAAVDAVFLHMLLKQIP